MIASLIRRSVAFHPATLVSVILASALLFGHSPRRVIQLLALALPGVCLLLLPIRSRAWLLGRALFVWAWATVFAADGLVRGYFTFSYDAAPKSSMVLTALANTGARESLEYLHMNSPVLCAWLGVLLVTTIALAASLRPTERQSQPGIPHGKKHLHYTLAAMCLVLAVAAYATPAWRKLHPAIYWAGWAEQVHAAREDSSDRSLSLSRSMSLAQGIRPQLIARTTTTVLFVISDSINRDNLSLYGYPRDTTPALSALKAKLGDNMLIIQNAWATRPSTVPALRDIFYFGAQAKSSSPHVLAIAEAVGFRTWWISNHDDFGIAQEHAQFADEARMLSRVPGRSAASLVENVIDDVKAALAHPAERKLIVVHLMGAHPHYSYRYPQNANPFISTSDSVDRDLRARGVWWWVRRLRKHYDAAILYHDAVVAQLLKQTIANSSARRAWLYVSDHGQEVGHQLNRAGHSATTAAGFRIPTMIWESNPRRAEARHIEASPLRLDWIGWTLMSLLGIAWQDFECTRDILHTDYLWHPPRIGARITSFTDSPRVPAQN